jgi:hypothetical protein
MGWNRGNEEATASTVNGKTSGTWGYDDEERRRRNVYQYM